VLRSEFEAIADTWTWMRCAIMHSLILLHSFRYPGCVDTYIMHKHQLLLRGNWNRTGRVCVYSCIFIWAVPCLHMKLLLTFGFHFISLNMWYITGFWFRGKWQWVYCVGSMIPMWSYEPDCVVSCAPISRYRYFMSVKNYPVNATRWAGPLTTAPKMYSENAKFHLYFARYG
jgi:hypothetical protein